jgi:hypothetical protein
MANIEETVTLLTRVQERLGSQTAETFGIPNLISSFRQAHTHGEVTLLRLAKEKKAAEAKPDADSDAEPDAESDAESKEGAGAGARSRPKPPEDDTGPRDQKPDAPKAPGND